MKQLIRLDDWKMKMNIFGVDFMSFEAADFEQTWGDIQITLGNYQEDKTLQSHPKMMTTVIGIQNNINREGATI